jgi:hypothetical protein
LSPIAFHVPPAFAALERDRRIGTAFKQALRRIELHHLPHQMYEIQDQDRKEHQQRHA